MQRIIDGYSVGNVHVQPGLVLSPMSGVTTRPFRRLLMELNPHSIGLTVSEFISVEALTRRVPRSLKMMQKHSSEKPYCIQIFGFDIQRMCESAQMVEDAGADIVDINCGCPAPKVVKKGGGCELMRNPGHLADMISKVQKAVSIPVTIKIRSGWDSSSLNAYEVARIAESEGAKAVAIHGRTRAQLYRGSADWEAIARIKENLKIPLLGSGDVVGQQSALERLEQSNVDGLFIGRAALHSPFVFREVMGVQKQDLRTQPEQVIKILRRYIELMLEDFEPRTTVGKLKQLTSQMCKGHPWRKEICRAKTFEEQMDILDKVEDSLDTYQTSSFESANNAYS